MCAKVFLVTICRLVSYVICDYAAPHFDSTPHNQLPFNGPVIVFKPLKLCITMRPDEVIFTKLVVSVGICPFLVANKKNPYDQILRIHQGIF